MSEESQSRITEDSLELNKSLKKMYAKSTLLNMVICLLSDTSFKLEKTALVEEAQEVINTVLAENSEVNLTALIDEALTPLKNSVSDDWLGKATCLASCALEGKSMRECNQRCGTNQAPPLA